MESAWRIVCGVMLLSCVIEGRSLNVTDPDETWQPPDGRSFEEWMSCYGQPADAWERLQPKLDELERNIKQQYARYSKMKLDNSIEQLTTTNIQKRMPTPTHPPAHGRCILLTEGQVDLILDSLRSRSTSGRRRRQLTDFVTSPADKWPMPIKYKFDGSQTDSQKNITRDAFHHWADNTCVRFQEVETNVSVTENHILLTSSGNGCYSYLGRVPFSPQQINLQDLCLSRFGTPVHEIGHALGLWHEQMRSDRDNYLTVNLDNIVQAYVTQFFKVSTANVVPYSYSSVMHYGTKDGSSVNGQDTMVAKNPLYQMNMGQRTGLAYEDIKAINMAYCSDSCSAAPSVACLRGGYQDPNNCSRCLCPDGFGGDFCQQLANSTGSGGNVNLDSGVSVTIKSPGYDSPMYYVSYTRTNWLITAPQGHVIRLQFVGDFSIYCQFGSCFHWVEVKYKKDLGLEGPRFCCSSRPKVNITSESNEMLVIFRSNFSNDYFPDQRGFQAVITAVPISGASPDSAAKTSTFTSTTTSTPSSTTTVSSSSSASSTSSTTTPTPAATPPATTTKSTTSKPPLRATPTIAAASTTTTTQIPTTTKTSTTSTTTSSTTTASSPRLVSDPTTRPLLLTFALDASSAVSTSDMSKTVSFLSQVVDRLTVSVPDTRLAVVTYSSQAAVALPVSSSFPDAISWLAPTNSDSRNIAGALRVARSVVNNSSLGSPVVDRVIVLVATGRATVDVDQTVPEALLARQAGFRILVVAVGSLVSGNEAAAVGGSDSNVVYADSFASLSTTNSVTGDTLMSKISQSANHPPPGDRLWSCSFEKPENVWCGMTQDTTDQFDWTVFSGPTPSDPTGPDSAYDGTYYIYIEASDPVRPNDEARIIFPRFQYSGVACVSFHYHMYGFHINRLKLMQRQSSVASTVWMRSHDMGNTWYFGAVELNLTTDSQLMLVGIRGEAYSGDIGLDAIAVSAGGCPQTS